MMPATVETQELTEEYLEKFRVTFKECLLRSPEGILYGYDDINILNDNQGYQASASIIKRTLFPDWPDLDNSCLMPLENYLERFIEPSLIALANRLCEEAKVEPPSPKIKFDIMMVKWAKKTALKLAEVNGWT